MRITKPHEVRRNEILNSAEKLFWTKGYQNTSVEDIISANGIAKGTFYYYFASKEEVMKAVVVRYTRWQGEIFRKLAEDTRYSAIQKLQNILIRSKEIQTNDAKNIEMLEMVHTSNAEIHMKSISESIQVLIPIIAEIVVQGNEEGVFRVAYPLTASQVIVTSMQILFNDAFVSGEREEKVKRLYEFSAVCESILGAEKGTLSFIGEVFRGLLR